MTQIKLVKGKPLMRGGKVVTNLSCCCADCTPGNGLPPQNDLPTTITLTITASGEGLSFNVFHRYFDVATMISDGYFVRVTSPPDTNFSNDGATGSWCEAGLGNYVGSAPFVNNPGSGDPGDDSGGVRAPYDCGFRGFFNFATSVLLRYGAVNGQKGWHLSLYGDTNPQDHCGISFFENTGAFDAFLGLAPSGTVSALCTIPGNSGSGSGNITFTWTLGFS